MIHKQTITAGRLDAKRYWCCLKRVNRSWDCVKSGVICYTWGPSFWHFQKVEVSDLPILAVELRYLRKTLLFLLTSSSEGPFCIDVFVSILWYVCQPLIPVLCRAGVNTHTNKQAPDKVYTQSHCDSRM